MTVINKAAVSVSEFNLLLFLEDILFYRARGFDNNADWEPEVESSKFLRNFVATYQTRKGYELQNHHMSLLTPFESHTCVPIWLQ